MYNIYHLILAFIIGGVLGKAAIYWRAKYVCKKKGCELTFKDLALWWRK